MCTRYYIYPENPEIENIISTIKSSPLTRRFMMAGNLIKTEGEIRPADVVPTIAPDPRGEEKIYPMKWGYTMHYNGKKLLLNARSETAFEKPTFRYDWLNHRCIIPASHYFEWAHDRKENGTVKIGDRYMIRPKDESVTWLCGLYHIEDKFPTFVVLTREPGPEVAKIHDRMPLILPSSLTSEWIRPGADPNDLMQEALTDMVVEKG